MKVSVYKLMVASAVVLSPAFAEGEGSTGGSDNNTWNTQVQGSTQNESDAPTYHDVADKTEAAAPAGGEKKGKKAAEKKPAAKKGAKDHHHEGGADHQGHVNKKVANKMTHEAESGASVKSASAVSEGPQATTTHTH